MIMSKRNKMMTLGKVSEMVDEMSTGHWDSVIKRSDIAFDNLERINIAGTTYNLRPVAQRSICARLNTPYTYLRKCPDQLQSDNLNHWLSKEKNKKFFVRFSGSDSVRAIFTLRYICCDNKVVMQHLFKAGYSPNTKVQCYLDDEFFSVSIPDKSKTFDISGDRISPGIAVSNSEVGLSSLHITAFYLRLVCTNGLISTNGVTESYRHISTRVLQEFPQVIQNVSNNLHKHRGKFGISMESHVEDPEATIKSFNRQFQLGPKEIEAVEWAIPQEVSTEDANMFQIIQAYTRSADFSGLTAEQRYKMQKVGGDILALVA